MRLQLNDTQITPVDAEGRRNINVSAGDTVRVWQKIVENKRTRLQAFEGIVLAKKHGNEPGATFTVRRVGTDGIAVEKIFPLYSPMIDRIEILRRVKVRRAKLYFLRSKTKKQVRDKLRRAILVAESTTSESKLKREAEEAVVADTTMNEEPAVEETKIEETTTEEVKADMPAEEPKVEEVQAETPAEEPKVEEAPVEEKTEE